MNYNEMSDQDINQRVTAIDFGIKAWDLSADGSQYYITNIDNEIIFSQAVEDYCNSSARWSELMTENNISVISSTLMHTAFSANSCVAKDAICGNVDIEVNASYSASAKKIGRAIAICFLKMSEG